MLVYFLFTFNLFAQQEKKLYKKAQKDFYKENFKSAKQNYLKLIKLQPENRTYLFETGIVYWNSEISKDSALYYLEQSLKYSIKDTIPELFYYLCKAQHYCKKYVDALNSAQLFEKQINTKTNDGREILPELNILKQYCQNAILKQTNSNFKTTLLNEGVNSNYHDYSPIYIKKDSVIIFTSRRMFNNKRKAPDRLYYENIFIAKNYNNSWTLENNPSETKKYLYPNYNSKKHNAAIAYQHNNKYLYLYKNNKIWLSVFSNNEWKQPEKLAKNINSSKFNIPSICISPDGNTIYFVATRKNGTGGKDIYTATKNPNGIWNEAIILGNNINSEFDEDAPFISDDGKTLYFSSKGHNSIGGYDIFQSKLDNNQWQKAENMGDPFNSPANDIFFSFNESEQSGFFSSNRKGGYGYMDIYSFSKECENLTPILITGIVLPKNKNSKNIYLEILDSKKQLLQKIKVDTSGRFSFTLKTNNNYTLSINTANTRHNQNISVEKYCTLPNLYLEIDINNSLINDSLNEEFITSRMVNLNSIESVNPNIEQLINISETKFSNLSENIALKDFLPELKNHFILNSIETEPENYNLSIIKSTQAYANLFTENKHKNLTKAEYINYFAYNEKEIKQAQKEYLQFIEQIIAHVKINGSVNISIESSASKVPTTSFISNTNLAEKRALEAKLLLFETLKLKGISSNAVKIKNIKPLVQGPEYSNDSHLIDKYKDFQYVRLKID
jgi:hypothetical protein